MIESNGRYFYDTYTCIAKVISIYHCHGYISFRSILFCKYERFLRDTFCIYCQMIVSQAIVQNVAKFNQRQFSYNKYVTGDGTWVHYSKRVKKKETNYTNYKHGRRLQLPIIKRTISTIKVLYRIFFSCDGLASLQIPLLEVTVKRVTYRFDQDGLLKNLMKNHHDRHILYSRFKHICVLHGECSFTYI